MNQKLKAAIIIAIIASVIVGTVLGVTYLLQTSNPVDVNVTSGVVYVPVTLSANATSLTDLDGLKLTATTESNGNGLVCHFYDGTAHIGQATIAGGIATLEFKPSLGSHTYTAGP